MDTAYRLEKRKARIAARGAAERRKHNRVPIKVPGRFMTPDQREYKCETVELSPGGAVFRASMRVRPGVRIVINLDGFGRFDGQSVRVIEGGFVVQFLAGPRKRDRIADELTWRYNKALLGLDDDRVAPRLPKSGKAKVLLQDGVVLTVDVQNISSTGISLISREKPDIGEIVQIGRLRGEVARWHDDGFAVRLFPPDGGEDKSGCETEAA